MLEVVDIGDREDRRILYMRMNYETKKSIQLTLAKKLRGNRHIFGNCIDLEMHGKQ